MSGGLGCPTCRTWEERYNTLLTLTKAQKKNQILIELDRKLQIATAQGKMLQLKYMDLFVKHDKLLRGVKE